MSKVNLKNLRCLFCKNYLIIPSFDNEICINNESYELYCENCQIYYMTCEKCSESLYIFDDESKELYSREDNNYTNEIENDIYVYLMKFVGCNMLSYDYDYEFLRPTKIVDTATYQASCFASTNNGIVSLFESDEELNDNQNRYENMTYDSYEKYYGDIKAFKFDRNFRKIYDDELEIELNFYVGDLNLYYLNSHLSFYMKKLTNISFTGIIDIDNIIWDYMDEIIKIIDCGSDYTIWKCTNCNNIYSINYS